MNAAKIVPPITNLSGPTSSGDLTIVSSFTSLRAQIIGFKEQKAKLVYNFLKATIYDMNNYENVNDPIRFKAVVDRYFNSLEIIDQDDYTKKLTMIQQAFGLPEKVVSEEAIFRAIFPFRNMKPTLPKEISRAIKALSSK